MRPLSVDLGLFAPARLRVCIPLDLDVDAGDAVRRIELDEVSADAFFLQASTSALPVQPLTNPSAVFSTPSVLRIVDTLIPLPPKKYSSLAVLFVAPICSWSMKTR
jgi:hypothetical protein